MGDSKLGRNDPCPCGSQKKYRICCLGKTDWRKLSAGPPSDIARHLSLRGKNILFLNAIATALQLDSIKPDGEYKDIKRACSPRAVQEIYGVIPEIWPDLDDYERCLQPESGTVTALYVGDYETDAVLRAVTRLSLYCDRIYLVDPFVNPKYIRDQYNPLIRPEEHRATVMKFTGLWMSLSPWIDSGMVYFVRPLHDFIPGLFHEIHNLARRRFDENPILKAVLEEEVAEQRKATEREHSELLMLTTPDEALRALHRDMSGERQPPKELSSEEDFLRYIQKRRDEHPYFVARLPNQRGEFYQKSSGASYELAKRMCSITNSHIVSSLRTRWKEVELDRESAGIDLQGWSPFAKALSESELKVLNSVPLEAAFRLREEKRLESLRLFFRKVWKSCRDPDEFSNENALNLSAELREEIAKAREEWEKIDQQLIKWMGVTGGAALSSGSVVGFVPAASAAVVTGITGLIQSSLKRRVFKERYPAGFFLGLKER